MQIKPFVLSLLMMMLAGAQLTSVARAQEGDPTQDPPTRAARLSDVEGSISLQPAGVQDWTAPAINRPLTLGDQLWSDGGSRAEIEFSTAALRMNEYSSVSLLDLSEQGVQLRLSSGSIVIAVRAYERDHALEIDAPNAAIVLLQPGEYRVDVDDLGNTLLTVRAGAAQATDSVGRSVTMQRGQAGQFGANGAFDVASIEPRDDFDRWSEQRDQRWVNNASDGQYVADDVVGAEDLSDSGQWQQVPNYGYVWFPTQVSYDWAPYRDGHWLWVSPWGWTWVDNAPWGYAPFHYGRWTYFNQHWGWVPAPAHQRAVYAPALVAWIGGPENGLGVGWLPLAPGEVYVPGYRVSARYAQNINISNTTIINTTYITNVYGNPALQNRYANHGAPRAITVVSQNTFVSGQGIAGHTLGSQTWAQQQPTARAPAIVPGRASVLGPNAGGRVARPPERLLDRPVLGRRPPPPMSAQFDAQVDAIRANHGRPLGPPRTPQGVTFNNANVHVVHSQPALAPPPQPVDLRSGDQGPRIPERSPGFQPPPQQQPRSEGSTIEQQPRNGGDPSSQPAPDERRGFDSRDSHPSDPRNDHSDLRDGQPAQPFVAAPRVLPSQPNTERPPANWQMQRSPVPLPRPSQSRLEPQPPVQSAPPSTPAALRPAPIPVEPPRQAPVTPPNRPSPQQQQQGRDRAPVPQDNPRRGRGDTTQPNS